MPAVTSNPARSTADLTVSSVTLSVSILSAALPTSILSGSMPGTVFSTRVRLLTQPPHDMPAMMKVLSIWPICIPPRPISYTPPPYAVKRGLRSHEAVRHLVSPVA